MMETVDLIVIVGLTHLSLSSVQALTYLLFSHSKFFNLMGSNFIAEQAPRGWQNEDPEPRVEGGGEGVQLKAKKKVVTSPILMADVILLEFKMCLSCCSYHIGCCREQV